MARDLDSITDTRAEYRELTLAPRAPPIRVLWDEALDGDLKGVDGVIDVMERESRSTSPGRALVLPVRGEEGAQVSAAEGSDVTRVALVDWSGEAGRGLESSRRE